jgi:ferric-dicitrate binding protein FerR (iron transport regulator)
MNDDIDLLISRHLDGSATDEESGRLDELVRRDPRVRRALYLAAEQEGQLREMLAVRRNVRLASAASGGDRRSWGLAAAAALLVAATLVLAVRSSSAPGPESPADPVLPPVVVKAAPPALVSPKPEVPVPAPVVPDPTPAPAELPKAPAPQPAPVPVAPAPAPVAPPSRSAPDRTVAVVATLEKAGGDVRILAAGTSTPAREGQTLIAGQSVETGPSGSRAVVGLASGVSVELAADTRVGAGSELTLERGSVRGDVAAARPRGSLVIATARAKAELGGTKFSMRTGPDATWLEVDRGRARFHRKEDGASLEVAGGQLAAVAPGVPFKALGQDAAVDQAKVDAAIARGVEFLRGAKAPSAAKKSDELILLTLLHAGVPASDPMFKRLLDGMLEAPLEKTYNVSLQAMILEELDRAKYQGRLQKCGQFLVDNQCKNGQWSYGTPSVFADNLPVPTDASKPEVASGGGRVRDFSAPKEKPKVTRKLPVKKTREGPASGDNSNSQYAALGLRACFDAGIEIPRDVVALAKDWWVKCQAKEEGADNGYGATRGWGYQKVTKDDDDDDKDGTLGSMTAGGVGSVVICDYMLGMDWKKDKTALAGLNWLASHFTVTDNPGGKPWRHYYYLYGLERAGILYGVDKIGTHLWYPEGARYLLEAQQPGGSWKLEQQGRTNPVWDTCFAVLFLKRATKPIDVASTDTKMQRR